MNFDQEHVSNDPRQEILDLLTQEMTQTRRRLSEMKSQIETTQTQVDREQNRYSSLMIEVRNIKDNLDTIPREDIRDKYDEALDVRFRMATMRGQLERLESTYEILEQKQTLLAQVSGKLQGAEMLVDDGDGNGAGNHEFDIVGIINAQEDERLKLSRQIHDSIAQSLTNFILQTEICQKLFDRNPERAAEELVVLKSTASGTFQKVRDFIFDLRPMMLDDLGVAPTVKRHVTLYREKHDIETQLDIKGEDTRLENYKEVMIFRAIQDLMSMARDYSHPTKVIVRLDMSGSLIKVVVEDDGRALDANRVFDKEEEHINDARIKTLRMIKSKFELVGGTVGINSSETDGTIVRLELPSEG